MYDLKQFQAVIYIAHGYLDTTHMSQVDTSPHQLFLQQIDKCLDVFTHLLICFAWLQLGEIEIGERRFEILEVEGITKEDADVSHWLGIDHTKDSEDVIAQLHDHISN